MPRTVSLLLAAALAAAGCAARPPAPAGWRFAWTSLDEARPPGWALATHGEAGAPDHAAVFPGDRVGTLAIDVAPSAWGAMLVDLASRFGPAGAPPPAGLAPPAGNPPWVPATITYRGATWVDVGIRFKGHSSLRGPWAEGSGKLPFKLDFDELEDERPAAFGQRFYGFEQLALAPNWADPSGLREAIGAELAEEAGLPAARTAFVELVLDHGEGAASLGLYTLCEVVDDTVVPRVFGGDAGNVYKPDGQAAGFAAGTREQIPGAFEKETNQRAADWSDVRRLFDVLHAPSRLEDPAAWRAGLATVFDVEAFLRWLALVALTQDWDAYGKLAHNYYLYADPADGRIHWIPWDHNAILQGDTGAPVSFDRAEVGPEWPLIRFLLDDPVYAAAYRRHMAELLDGPFAIARTDARIARLAGLAAPVMARDGGEAAFRKAVDELAAIAHARHAAARAYLAGG